MATVTIADLWTPDVWNDAFLELTTTSSSLIESGIVVVDPFINSLAQGGGNLITMPFFNDLTGDDEILSDSSPLTPQIIGSGQDAARLHLRGDARSVNDLSADMSGADPLMVIMNRVLAYWDRREQDLLVSTLIGMFEDNSDNDSGDLILTHGAEQTGSQVAWNGSSPTVMCPEAILDGQALLGDAQDRFTAIMMHSKCYTDLLKQELIDFVRPSGSPSAIKMYLDKRVIINDLCPTRAGTTSGTLYQSFLFGEGAIARGEGRASVPSELDRDALAHDTRFITRRHFLLHPRGIKWEEGSVSGAAPTNDECELAANWNRVYDQKNIRIAMIETN